MRRLKSIVPRKARKSQFPASSDGLSEALVITANLTPLLNFRPPLSLLPLLFREGFPELPFRLMLAFSASIFSSSKETLTLYSPNFTFPREIILTLIFPAFFPSSSVKSQAHPLPFSMNKIKDSTTNLSQEGPNVAAVGSLKPL